MVEHPQKHDFLYDARLRKVERLLKRAQFLHAQRSGMRRSGDRFTLLLCVNGLEHSRLGITTSRKVGGAVVRNRWRRLIREAYRLHKAEFPQGYDIVVIVKPKQKPTSMMDVFEEIASQAHRALRRGKKLI